MDQSRRKMVKRLEEMGRGDVPSSEASAIIREALAQGSDLVPYVHSALSDATWRLLTSRSFDDELVVWHEAFMQAEALMEDHSPESAAETRALTNLLAKSHRFLEAQPANEVLRKKHVIEILSFIDQAGKQVSRNALREHVGLLDANLSRVLVILTSRGLLRRNGEGREAYFEMTLEGSAALRSTQKEAKLAQHTRAEGDMSWAASWLPWAVWKKAGGELLASSKAFGKLAHDGGMEVQNGPNLEDWQSVLATMSEGRSVDNQTFQLDADDRTYACRLHNVERDRVGFFGFDVTSYVARQRALEEDCAFLMAKVASLRKELADLRHILSAWDAVLRPTRDAVANVIKRSQKLLVQRLHKDKAVETDRALAHLSNAANLGLEDSHWPTLYIADDLLPKRLEKLDSKQFVHDFITDVEMLVDRDIPVKTNIRKDLDVDLYAFSGPLRGVSTGFLISCKDARETTANFSMKGNHLVVVLNAAQFSKSASSQEFEGWLESCQHLMKGVGGDLDWSLEPTNARMEVRVPASVHK
ncbi:hypothetical protein ACU8M5_09210 [Rhizobium leguminosarum]